MNSKNQNALTLAEFKKKIADGCIIIDTRSAAEFLNGFIPGSVFWNLSKGFLDIPETLFAGKEFILADDGRAGKAGASDLEHLNIAGYLKGGFQTWLKGGQSTDMIIDIEADEFALDLPFDDKLLILDVRQPQKYALTHVTGSIHMPLSQFGDVSSLARFEEDWNIYIYGETDNESLTAISLMQRQGFYNVRNISGGFKSILKQDSIPIEKGGTPEEI